MRDATQMLGFISPAGTQVRIASPTEDALREFVAAYQDRPQFVGFPLRRGEDGELETEVIPQHGVTVKFYVNEDRWVGDCPYCNSGIAGVYRAPVCVCLDCGREMLAEFPPEPDVSVAEVVLAARPETNRNWRPDLGEDVDDLKVENVTRGIRIT
jgi:hypothetical protein